MTSWDELSAMARAMDERFGPLCPLLTSPDPADWPARAEAIRGRLLEFMGPFPDCDEPVTAEVGEAVAEDGYTRRKVWYTTEPGESVPAWLLVPEGDGPFPAIMALHPTHAAGKDVPVGLDGNEHRHYGKELARRGYVVLAPDVITAGERLEEGWEPYVTEPFDRARPDWSAMGKMVWDHRRGLDYLATLECVDIARVGAIGHSLGAYNAFFLGMFDQRVGAVVESCGYTTMAADPNTERWARDHWFVHLPKLRPYVLNDRTDPAPFEWHEALALLAPRPFFQYAGRSDSCFPNTESLAQVHLALAPLYELLGGAGRVTSLLEPGPHDFPDPARAEAYAFLDQWVKQA